MRLLTLLTEYLGGGGYLQITPNTPKEVVFGDKVLTFKELWGRVDISQDSAILEFDAIKPLPAFKTKVLGFEVTGTISGLEITDEKVLANTSLGQHQIWP